MMRRFSSFILAAPLAMTLLSGCESGKPMEEAIANPTTAADTTSAETTASVETTAAPVFDDGLVADKYTGIFTTEGNWQWSSALTSPMKIYPETLWVTGAAGGLNNAFWMINAGKEIDIVEAHYMNVINTNLHINENGQNKQYSERRTSDFDLSVDFHNYALHWTETELIYYFDGEEIARKANYGRDTEMWPYLSTAVLNWAGKIDDEADGKAMEVEWVRIYQEK